MVYIANDGTVHAKEPWSIKWFLGLFTGFYNFLVAFFMTLISPLSELQGSGAAANQRGGGWGPGGGGGGGGGGGSTGSGNGNSGGNNGPRNRRVGRIMRMSDCVVPGGG